MKFIFMFFKFVSQSEPGTTFFAF